MGGYEPNPIPWAGGRHPRRLPFHSCCRFRLRPLRAVHGTRHRPRAGAGNRRDQAVAQRPRELHPGRQLHPRRGAGAARLLRRRGLQRLRHRLGGGAGMALAEWVVKGAPPFDLWPVDIRRFGRPPRPPGARPHAGGLRQALHHRLAVRGARTGRPARRSPLYANLKRAGRLLRREARLGAAQLVRRSGARRGARRTATASAAPAGSTRWPASTAPRARPRC
jgi:sarcosine dehydrogenase